MGKKNKKSSEKGLEGFSTSELKALHEDSFGGTRNAHKQIYRADNPWATGQPGDPFAKTRVGGDGRRRPTRAQAKENLEQIYNVPGDPNKPNWVKVRDAMGLKDVNSQSDLNAMHREVHMEHNRRHTEKATKGLRDRITELENQPAPTAQPEAQPEEKPKDRYFPAVEPERTVINGQGDSNQGFDPSQYDWAKRMNGAEAPGQAEYAKAKEKAQAYKSPDYTFEGGSYGDQPESGSDAYGNSTPEKMDAEHKAEQLKNSHVEKAKEIGGMRTMEFRDSDGNGIDDRDDGTPRADRIRENQRNSPAIKYPG